MFDELKKKTDKKLLKIYLSCSLVEDLDLLKRCKKEIERREVYKNHKAFWEEFWEKEAEQSILDGEKSDSLKTYKCGHCKIESIFPKKRVSARCLNCNKVLLI